jgi:hypothetical protein
LQLRKKRLLTISFVLFELVKNLEVLQRVHSVSSHALNFSQLSQSLGFFGPSSPALSHIEQGEAALLHVFGVAGNRGPFMHTFPSANKNQVSFVI